MAAGKKGKPRHDTVLAIKQDGDIYSIIPDVKRPVDGRALAAKLQERSQLTPEEREHLASLLAQDWETERRQWVGAKDELSLRVAMYFIILRAAWPEEKVATIEDLVAETYRCSRASVRHDVRLAKKLDGGLWWEIAARDLILPER